MSDKSKCKVSINYEDRNESIACRGFAGVVIDDAEGGYDTNIILVGNMSVKHLIVLYKELQESLMPLIKEEAVEAAKVDPVKLLEKLLG